jgi:hypothetical protein
MRHYDTLLDEKRGPFQVIVDKSWEDLNPRDMFEEDDVDEICRKIDDCTYDWFMLRTRILYEGVELACEYLGGCLYEDAKDVLTDGMAEDQIYQAMLHAKVELAAMKKKFEKIDVDALDALAI